MNLVPKLRFSEFTDEWQKKRLGQVVKFSRGGSLSKAELKESGKYKAIHYGELFTKYSEIILNIKSRTDVDSGVNSEIDDILMPTSDVTPQGLARASVIKECGVKLGGDINILKPNNGISSIFLSYVLNSQKRKIMKIVSGTTVRHVYNSDLTNVNYCLPVSKREQQKIADFLTAVDNKISTIDKKVELLKEYKKGVMQKIFSQEIRFKDKNGHYEDWTTYNLGNLLIKNSIKNKNSRYGLVQSVSNTRGFVDQSELFNDRIIASKDLSGYYVIKKGIFAYNPSRIDVGSLAYKTDDVISVVSPLYISFAANSHLLIDCFLSAWFDSSKFIKQMTNSFEGSVRNTLSYESLCKMKLKLPIKDEQQKIADFLIRLDAKISLSEQKLNQAKQFKKALLQNMFA